MRTIKFWLINLALVPVAALAQPDSTLTPLETPQQAWIRALEYTGFARAIDTSIVEVEEVATRVTVTDDKTPFFHHRINGRQLWLVTLDSVILEIPGLAYHIIEGQTPKTFEVLLDPETGQLLSIRSKFIGDSSNVSPMRHPDTTESKMRRNNEFYEDLLPSPPPTDFYSALANAREAYPVQSKQLLAVCLLYTTPRFESRPVWIILGRGTPPSRRSGLKPGSGLWTINNWRCVIDAQTGARIMVEGYP